MWEKNVAIKISGKRTPSNKVVRRKSQQKKTPKNKKNPKNPPELGPPKPPKKPPQNGRKNPVSSLDNKGAIEGEKTKERGKETCRGRGK